MTPLAMTLALAACGGDPETTTDSVEPGRDQRYTATAVVLESPEHGPQLCLAGVAESLPPQCGGPDIDGWDWDEAGDFESASGTKWATYTLVGTYRDGVFTLSEPPARPDENAVPGRAAMGPTTPCSEPDGGWGVVDEATATDSAMNAAISYAREQPEFAGVFLDQSINPALSDAENLDASEIEAVANDPKKLVLNFRFTDDVERHESEIRKLWGGSLCVSQAEHTEADLREIQRELHETYSEALGSGVDTMSGRVELTVIVDDGSLQAQLDDRYGEGVVVVHSALQPVG